eukprot:4253218-Pleurochrysis_carterae.AAC.1
MHWRILEVPDGQRRRRMGMLVIEGCGICAQLAELQAAVGAGTLVGSRTQPSAHPTCAPTPKSAPRTDPSVAAWQSVEARLAAIQAAMDHKHTTDLNFQQ